MVDSKITDLTALTTVADADVLAIVDDTSGTPITKKITKANLVKDITAVNGGTGLITYTVGDILYCSATNVLSKLAVGTVGQVLTLAGGIPTWATASAGGGASFTWKNNLNGEIFTGNIGYFVVPDELDGKDIKEVRLAVLSLPTGADITIDVRKNGTASTDSIYTSDVVQDLAAAESATNGVYQSGCDTSGSTVGTAGTTLDAARVSLSADDILYFFIVSVGSTLTGTDFTGEVIIG